MAQLAGDGREIVKVNGRDAVTENEVDHVIEYDVRHTADGAGNAAFEDSADGVCKAHIKQNTRQEHHTDPAKDAPGGLKDDLHCGHAIHTATGEDIEQMIDKARDGDRDQIDRQNGTQTAKQIGRGLDVARLFDLIKAVGIIVTETDRRGDDGKQRHGVHHDLGTAGIVDVLQKQRAADDETRVGIPDHIHDRGVEIAVAALERLVNADDGKQQHGEVKGHAAKERF